MATRTSRPARKTAGGNSARPNIRGKLPGPKARTALAKDKLYVSPSYTRSYPLVVHRGRGMMIDDVDGNTFLDFTGGVAVNVLGHAHPELLRVIREQTEKFIHMAGTDFYYTLQSDLAEKLSEITPGKGRKVSFLTNSGTESIEAAIKLARYVTRRPRMIAFTGGFHGRSMGALSLTSSKAIQRRHFSPLLADVSHVPYAYCYRCPYNLEPKTCSMACLDFIEEWVFKRIAPPEDVAAIVVEPIQGEGGYVVPPPDYFPKLRKMCDKYGILLIADEIQCGLGRTGKMFAIEHWGVEPDIICIAKGIASGLPLGAMVARAGLFTWPSGAHANTFGGNPVACAAALKTLELIQSSLMENARVMGAHLHERLEELKDRFDCIGDHRGLGLMQGLEIVKSKKSRAREHDLRNEIVRRSFEQGLLLLGCGDNSLRFSPSLILNREHIDVAIEILAKVFKSV